MTYIKLVFIILISFQISEVSAQDLKDETIWSWIRLEGSLDQNDQDEANSNKLPYSIEWHYRLKNDARDFHQVLLRPMIGYNLDNNSTIWLGYAWIGQDMNGNFVNEHRLFQMVTTKGKVGETPVLYLAGARLEQRVLENQEELNHRLRMSLRFSIPLAQNKNYKLSLIFQDEVFVRLNQTNWAGAQGYDQNRFYIGLEHQTKIKDTPVSFNAGYQYLHTPSKGTHMLNVGVRININQGKKTKKPKSF